MPSLAVSSVEVPRGATCDAFVRLTSEDPVQAFSLGVAHDPAVAELAGIDYEGCATLEALNGGAGPQFFSVDIDAGTAGCGGAAAAGGTVYSIASIDQTAEHVIPPGADEPIVRLTYRATAGAAVGSSSPLELVGCLGDRKPWALVLAIDLVSVAPRTTDGLLVVTEPRDWFRRGDANRDGRCDISDAVVTLAHLFGDDAIVEACRDAADANDDGKLDIADAVATLAFLFGGGSPLPPPFEECGNDPTADELECREYAPCENS
jgi:hypothetical protein